MSLVYLLRSGMSLVDVYFCMVVSQRQNVSNLKLEMSFLLSYGLLLFMDWDSDPIDQLILSARPLAPWWV